ncbi:AlpA family transcriptional regulator [Mesorhizobium sp. M3A.F.Ca.ET.201.01.1.1]|uniref:helix-turn-helix transcriptional regulator n=1 Tax=Mesorhizobium sp. M3A.F.Ca.ET.201.01.1.1 TaxID=2563946 RepID=UPI0010941500|nr:AlpA family transcriptional regulator [Mesorhizobium sp. M3A.F.Ca.ET.201.01.1.1]TGS69006.1 AlpA family transcriptional regulator [Mesorhizobium sp. M3A.F.Ca.ET.201.01.1.1]
MADRFISMDEVVDRVSFSRTHIYRKIADGTFPRPVPLGPQKVAFLEHEIDQWMEERVDARNSLEGIEERRLRAAQVSRGVR